MNTTPRDENDNTPAQARLREQFERMIAMLHGVPPAQLMVDFLYEMSAQNPGSVELEDIVDSAESIVDILYYG